MRSFVVGFVSVFLSFGGAVASAQEHRLSVLVEDPSGATIPNASIIVLAGSDLLTEQSADAKGIAVINVGKSTTLKLVVTAEGFATAEVEVAFPARATAHTVTVSMGLANIETDVTVSATESQAEA